MGDTAHDNVLSALGQGLGMLLAERLPPRSRTIPGADTPIPAVAQPAVQLLVPMVPWDWPVAPVRSVPASFWMLADAVPRALDAGVAFDPSGASFSQSYLRFLQLLDASRFPLKQALDQALAFAAPPACAVDSGTVPDGWTCAADGAGLLRWRLAYQASMTPQDWVASVAAAPAGSVTLTLPLAGQGALTLTDANGVQQPLPLGDDVDEAVVTADAMSQVGVWPGMWYDDSLLRLGRNGPFVAGVPPNPAYGGLLSGHVGSLVVAYNPELHIHGDRLGNGATGRALRTASVVQAGGLRFTPGMQATDGDPNRYQASAPGAWIVGVTIEAFG